MDYKLRCGILTVYDVENVIFIDIFKGHRLRIALPVENNLFDGIINIDSLSNEYRLLVQLLIKKKCLISCDTDKKVRKIVDEIYDELHIE